MKNLITTLILFIFITLSLSAQIRLDVEGDAKIRGKLDIRIGTNNIFIGTNAGINNTTGASNTFLGTLAGVSNTASNNTFIGFQSGNKNTSGTSNTFIGLNTGFNNNANNNTFIGFQAGLSNSGGVSNTFIGSLAGINNTDGGNNTFIGNNSGLSTVGINLNGAMAIGNEAKVDCDNCAVIGGTGINAVKVGIGTTTPLTDLHIKQSEFNQSTSGIRLEENGTNNFWTASINTVDEYSLAFNGSPIGYISHTSGNYVNLVPPPPPFTNPNDGSSSRNSPIQSMDKVLVKVKRLNPITKKINNGRNSSKAWGFVAEEVARIFPEITPEKDGRKGIIYDYFGILSIKAIQELAIELEEEKMQRQEQEQELKGYKKAIEKLAQEMQEYKALVETLIGEKATDAKVASQVLTLEKKASLSQNYPNPFNQHTLVNYFVPQNVSAAKIQVTDAAGKVLGILDIAQKGKGQVSIDADTYPAGVYYYSLVLDGQVFETKRMMLTR